jgi:YidC/Oxa1 family membrane protein insertase
MQPQIQAIQKKYKDNPQKMQEEFQKIGYNPADTLTGCLPLLIQMPILIGLYRAIIYSLGSTPQALFELTQRVYSFIDLTNLLPISNKFLWMNLGQPDPWFVLPVLVFATMFLQQKLMTPATQKQGKDKKQDDNPAAAMTQSMQWTMPIMFGFFSLQFQSGLSIYFILSNIIGIGQGYYMRNSMAQLKVEAESKKKTAPVVVDSEPEPEQKPVTAVKKKANTDDDLEVAMKGTDEERKQYQSRKRTSKRKRKSR